MEPADPEPVAYPVWNIPVLAVTGEDAGRVFVAVAEVADMELSHAPPLFVQAA